MGTLFRSLRLNNYPAGKQERNRNDKTKSLKQQGTFFIVSRPNKKNTERFRELKEDTTMKKNMMRVLVSAMAGAMIWERRRLHKTTMMW